MVKVVSGTGQLKNLTVRRLQLKGKYDSKFEKKLHQGPLRKWLHHVDAIPYITESKYQPDFKHPTIPNLYIEAKGRFRDSKEAAKYVWFKKSNPHITLIFVFQNPNKPMPGARRRKDGTKYTHAEWADKNGFEYRSYKL